MDRRHNGVVAWKILEQGCMVWDSQGRHVAGPHSGSVELPCGVKQCDHDSGLKTKNLTQDQSFLASPSTGATCFLWGRVASVVVVRLVRKGVKVIFVKSPEQK